MRKANSFFDKYKKLMPRERQVREVVTAAVKAATKIDLAPAEIKVSGRTVFIKASAAKKSEIFLHRIKILAALRRDLAEGAPTAIL